MHFGLGLLRLTPETFWSLTLRELMALGGASRPVDTLDRATLAAMMRRWPDAAPGGTPHEAREILHGRG